MPRDRLRIQGADYGRLRLWGCQPKGPGVGPELSPVVEFLKMTIWVDAPVSQSPKTSSEVA